MLNNQPNINLNDPEMSDFPHQLPSPNIAGASDADYDVKLAALRAEIQLGIDALERGEYTKIDMDSFRRIFCKTYS